MKYILIEMKILILSLKEKIVRNFLVESYAQSDRYSTRSSLNCLSSDEWKSVTE
jgi:hypothetical protein